MATLSQACIVKLFFHFVSMLNFLYFINKCLHLGISELYSSLSLVGIHAYIFMVILLSHIRLRYSRLHSVMGLHLSKFYVIYWVQNPSICYLWHIHVLYVSERFLIIYFRLSHLEFRWDQLQAFIASAGIRLGHIE